MAKNNRTLTVIVVPQTAKRSYSFTFAPAWLAVVGILFVGLAGGLWFFQQEAQTLRTELVELEELRKTNRVQQAQIEEMQAKALTIQDRLAELETLEQQIKQMTGQTSAASSRSVDVRETLASPAGRGGPQAAANRQENLPTLATMLPEDVRGYVVGRRDTLELDLRLSRTSLPPEKTLLAARETNQALADQLELVAQSKEALTQGKQDIADLLDFLAHRPTGLPIAGARITDRFGWRWSPFGWGQQQHDGIDFAHEYWAPIHATGDGVVNHAGWKSGGYGYTVVIDHGYGFRTLYAHMVDWNVKYGQEVKRGEVIGWVGNTGLSTGPHVHYEVHLNGVAVDPTPYLQ
ncbi:MAG: peptidoglycan DD-metalloendopeptidase family protein [Bacillota bacterium]